MNLFFKSYKFYLFFLLICAANVPILLGNNVDTEFTLLPEILRYDIPPQFNKTPNTSFCRNIKGVVFIGKENGFLAIDNEKVFFTPSSSPVFISKTVNDRIFYLKENDFGYISYDILEGPVLNSWINKIPSQARNFFPQGITCFDSKTFLCTSEGIFVASDSSVKQFFFNRLSCSLFNSGGFLFLEVEGQGIYQWDESQFKLLAASSKIISAKIASVFEEKKAAIINTTNGGMYRVDLENNNISELNSRQSSAGNFKFFHHLYDDKSLWIGKDSELFMFSLNDSLFHTLSDKGVLPSTDLKSVFVDNFNDIWLIYDYNIFKIEYPSATNTLNLKDLISGTILSSVIFNQSFYLASTDGLLKINIDGSEILKPEFLTKNDDPLILLLSSFDTLLIAAGNAGLFKISGDQFLLIDAGNFSYIKLIDPHTIIACNERGLLRYNLSDGQWKSKLLGEKSCHVISDIEFENRLWLHLNDHSLISIQNEEGLLHNELSQLSEDNFRLIVLNKDLVLFGNKVAYLWNKKSEKFESTEHSAFAQQLMHSDLIVNGPEYLWCSKKEVSGAYSIWKINRDMLNIPYYEIPAKNQFGQVIDMNETKEYLWIIGNKKIIQLNKNSSQTAPQSPVIVQSVMFSYPDANKNEINIQQNDKIRFGKNKLTIILKPQRYLASQNLYFRYKLTHYQDEWSEWSRENTIVFSKLRERDYTFKAQSISSLGPLSDPVIFEFTVTPPFYRKWYAILIYVFLCLTVAFLIYKWRLLSLKKVEFKVEERIRERMASVLEEKEKSDKLVEDLFPKGTADEIRNSGRAKSKKFEMATVLFSDIQGFTKIAEEMNPEVLIDELDKFFFHFDSVVEKYNIEKIKTIGDAYMAAGGIPVKNSSNPVEVVLAGLEMQNYMNNLKKLKTDIWDLRIGIHTGPIISGVVGSKKLSYDIWGDTVNTASRMESSGEGGKVNISGITYNLIKDYFLCEYRGKLPVKYKGNIDMYFVTGLRPELAIDLHGIPNKRFFIKLQLLRLKDLEERVFEEILADQILNLHFHKPDFIRKVFNQVELLGRSENISDEELLLTQSAALLLYSGLSETSENYENKSAEIARSILPEYGYDEKQIDRVCNLILAAKKPFNPQNILEKILIDSKMEYIGRKDYLTQIKLLFLEKKNLIKDVSTEKLVRRQTAILKEFSFFTLAAQRLREVDAERQIENLKSWK